MSAPECTERTGHYYTIHETQYATFGKCTNCKITTMEKGSMIPKYYRVRRGVSQIWWKGVWVDTATGREYDK